MSHSLARILQSLRKAAALRQAEELGDCLKSGQLKCSFWYEGDHYQPRGLSDKELAYPDKTLPSLAKDGKLFDSVMNTQWMIGSTSALHVDLRQVMRDIERFAGPDQMHNFQLLATHVIVGAEHKKRGAR